MDNVVFDINPADLQFDGSIKEPKKASGVMVVFVLVMVVVVATIFLWYFLKKPSLQTRDFETENTNRVL
ncbi:hypothetical protein [Adhaeribacter soli]|uniref:Uncharacterized protein n=1 Tax=Adhaeribacter soli TaxID=2607655 RepID=A0A5N1J4Y5_9BACT|nr:hypothetical protein [Adhaeribacter soli]KAA9340139.1 hypothetical protein F0P94_07260 [Adhaeribacter soli]